MIGTKNGTVWQFPIKLDKHEPCGPAISLTQDVDTREMKLIFI